MTWSDLLRSALFGLFQHKLRTLLTLSGVTLGSLLLFTSLSGGLGVIDTVNRRLGVGERLLEINVSSGFILNPVTAEAARNAGFTQQMSEDRRIRLAKASGVGGRQNVALDLESAKQLELIEHVDSVWPVIDFRASMYFEKTDCWTQAAVKAVRPSKDLSSFIFVGRGFNQDSVNEIVVSELYLYKQGIQSDADVAAIIGSKVRFMPVNNVLSQSSRGLQAIDSVKTQQPDSTDGPKIDDPEIDGKKFTGEGVEELRDGLLQKIAAEVANAKFQTEDFEIVGVVRTPQVEEVRFRPDLHQLTRDVLMPHPSANEIWKMLNVSGSQVQVIVRADKPENVMRVETAISDIGFQTMSMSKVALQIRSAVLLITAIVTAIATAALLISGIGITNTMLMNVLERRREIAIMKSIGAQDRDVSRIFLLEGMLIGVVGGIAGLILGYVLSRLTGDYIRQVLEWRLKEPFGDDIFAYPIWLFAATPILSSLVTTIASALPARQAARVDPVEALRAL